jgi:hypothetical protein
MSHNLPANHVGSVAIFVGATVSFCAIISHLYHILLLLFYKNKWKKEK